MMRAEARKFLDMLTADEIGEVYVAKPVGPAKTRPLTASGETLSGLCAQVMPCALCPELAQTRKSVVFGSGSDRAQLMFVGEAPGADEDLQGLPFVGQAGQLLTKIIESIQMKRDEVYIANVLKCRPPGNRPPRPEESANCKPYLIRQIERIRPKIVCALGTFAAQTLLESEAPISQLRGKFYARDGYKLLATYHPAYLLRNPSEKRKVWEDMKLIKRELEALNA
jgi:uracil-DNA glycosylase